MLVHVQLDRERSNYGLKEANLVRFLIRACLLDPKTSTAAQRAENWRQAGIKNAGQFSKVMEEVRIQNGTILWKSAAATSARLPVCVGRACVAVPTHCPDGLSFVH